MSNTNSLVNKIRSRGGQLRDNLLKKITEIGLLDGLKWNGIDVGFIISTGRTGTTFLAKYFDKSRGIKSLKEPKPKFIRIGQEYAAGNVDHEYVKKKWNSHRKLVLSKLYLSGHKKYIESNTYLFSLIPILRECFDNPKFVHIVRDGRSYVRSGMSRFWFKDSDPYPRLTAKMVPDDEYHDKWDKLSRFEKICWIWDRRDEFIRREVEHYNDSVTVKFENIFSKEIKFKGMKDIISHLKVNVPIKQDVMMRPSNETSSYEIPPWEGWSSERKSKFLDIAGNRMEKYGYL